MIKEMDLRQAIAECQGERNPNAQTCIKLAAYYTILDQITRSDMEYGVRMSGSGTASSGSEIPLDTGTEFSDVIKGKDPVDVWPVMDEAMTALQVLHPRFYDSIIRKLKSQV